MGFHHHYVDNRTLIHTGFDSATPGGRLFWRLDFYTKPILLEHVTGDEALGYRMDCLQNSITLQLPWELTYSLLIVQLFWHWSHTHMSFESQTFCLLPACGFKAAVVAFSFSFSSPVCGYSFVDNFAPFILHDFIHMIEPL